VRSTLLCVLGGGGGFVLTFPDVAQSCSAEDSVRLKAQTHWLETIAAELSTQLILRCILRLLVSINFEELCPLGCYAVWLL
jgi:hypothetical protein